MCIENLLVEQQSLKNKITKAMIELKNWFIDKIDKVRDYFNELRDKFMSNRRTIKQDSTPIDKNVIIGEKVIFRKGTPVNKVWSKICKTMSSAKAETEKVIKQCKEGIRNVMNHNKERALSNKKQAIKYVKQLSLMGSIVLGGIGAIIMCQRRKKSAKDQSESKNGNNYNTSNNMIGTSKEDIPMLGNSKKDLKMISTNRDSVKLLTMSKPEDKVDEVKKTIENKVKNINKAKKVNEVRTTIKRKAKENKITRKAKKSVLKNNPLDGINNSSDINAIRSKIQGLYKTIKRSETQYEKIEKDRKAKIKEIMSKHSGEEAKKLINELDKRTKTRLNSYADKIDMSYSEIDKLNELLKSKE